MEPAKSRSDIPKAPVGLCNKPIRYGGGWVRCSDAVQSAGRRFCRRHTKQTTENNRKYHDNRRMALFQAFEEKCECCGYSDFAVMRWEHYNLDSDAKQRINELAREINQREPRKKANGDVITNIEYLRGVGYVMICANCSENRRHHRSNVCNTHGTLLHDVVKSKLRLK